MTAKWKNVDLSGGGPLDGQKVTVPTSWTAYRPHKASGVYKASGAGAWCWTPDPK